MRVRAMTSSGDMRFGHSAADFLANSPEAVAQAVQTRLGLWQGEWFLDLTAGTPYLNKILGVHPQPIYDAAISARILETPGMIALAEYASQHDAATRALTVQATGITQYGTTQPIQTPPLIPPG
jgi:hypothetical protein